jgi:hypothetical protein
MSEKFLGIVDIPSSNLRFADKLGERRVNKEQVRYLQDVYQKKGRNIKLDDLDNWIRG